MNLNNENFHLVAARAYTKRVCVSTKLFFQDLAETDLNKTISKFDKERSTALLRQVINKIIISTNLFGPTAIDLILFQLREEHINIAYNIFDEINILPIGTKFIKEPNLKDIINDALNNK